jgi:hypothetical protein
MILFIIEIVSYTSIICMILLYDTTHYGQPNGELPSTVSSSAHNLLFSSITTVPLPHNNHLLGSYVPFGVQHLSLAPSTNPLPDLHRHSWSWGSRQFLPEFHVARLCAHGSAGHSRDPRSRPQVSFREKIFPNPL